jgi:phosphoglycolate phosphatase
MIKLLVCDWDGTLCDSIGPITLCKRVLARKYQLPEPDDNTVKSALGLPIKKAFAHCFNTANRTTRDALQDDFHTLMLTPEFHATLFEEAIPFIKRMHEKNIITTIATSKSRIELNHSLKENQCAHLFNATCSGEEYEPKPEPGMLHHLLKQFGCAPEDALMIGDSVCDIDMAKNAGVKSVAVTFGAANYDALQAAEPSAIAKTWPELITLATQL